jgi:hypothetical protein
MILSLEQIALGRSLHGYIIESIGDRTAVKRNQKGGEK